MITIKINKENLLPIRDSENIIIGKAKVTEEITIGKIKSWKLSDSKDSKSKIIQKIHARVAQW